MGMLDGKYWAIFFAGGLEGIVEAGEETFERILKLLRDDYKETTGWKNAGDEEFTLALKFDAYTLVWNGKSLDPWYAVNLQKLA